MHQGSEIPFKKSMEIWESRGRIQNSRVDHNTFTMGNPMPESTLKRYYDEKFMG